MLNFILTYDTPVEKSRGLCMKGSIYFHKKSNSWVVGWYDRKKKKKYTLYKYKGEYMYSEKIARKLLATMQSDYENNVFDINKYKGNQEWSDIIPYMDNWVENVKDTLSPATYKDYKNSIKNHLKPFFQKHKFQLHEIKYDTLMLLLSKIKRKGKGKFNVMYCLRACLSYAWKSERIPIVPKFPEKKHYRIEDPEIEWLPEDRQIAIINAIPMEHQPIFWWLKYHLRRPAEAMALHREDYRPDKNIFVVHRSISNRKLVNRTKTGEVHVIPCHSEFTEMAKKQHQKVSKFFFTNRLSRSDGKRYSHSSLSRIWKEACKKVGEDIDLYSGLKHSSCSQFINEKGLSMDELQSITDHARVESVKRYAKMEVARKRELMEKGKVIKLHSGQKLVTDEN